MKKERKGSTKLILLIVAIVVVLVIVIGTLGYFMINDAKQRITLKDEIEAINKNLTVDMTIKTTGKYADLEKALKEYLNEYHTAVNNLATEYGKSNIGNCLSADSISKNGPEFTSMKEELNLLITQGNEVKDKITKMTSDEYMQKKVEEAKLEGKYKDMFYSTLDLKSNATKNSSGIDTYNTYFNKILTVFNFLTNNKDNWKVNNNKVEFNSVDLVTEYNKLVNETLTAQKAAGIK